MIEIKSIFFSLPCTSALHVSLQSLYFSHLGVEQSFNEKNCYKILYLTSTQL